MVGTLDALILVAIWVGGIAYTLFTPAYLWWGYGTWNRTLVGWALASAATSSALLLDLTLVFRTWEPSPLVGAWVTLAVVGLIAVGGCLKLAAIIREIRLHGSMRS
jgi:hypothetical protein